MYGSSVQKTDNELGKDVDLIIIVDHLSAVDLKNCAKETKNWSKRNNPVPVLMSADEWFCSNDVYAMEYADIKDNYRILYGENLIKSIEIKRCDLRLQCELEAKNMLMRYRKYYLLNSHCNIDLKKSFVPAFKNCIAVFKTVLRLKEIEVPKTSGPIIEEMAQIQSQSQIIDKELFVRLLCFKENKCKIENVGETAHRLIDSMDRLLKYINYM